jgi:2-polyprenyl-6-methoxyphenol hydroxylase-like FAD-dependent oxidoreductase
LENGMNTSVLIVGAGPVGLTLACELTRYRIPVRIVDKAAQRTDKSKAIVIWSRTLELLDRGDRGSAPFVEAGFRVDGVNIVAPEGRVIGHVKMDSVASPYPYAMMLPQSDTERLLEERLQRLGVSVERSTEATPLTIGADGVEVTLRRADGRRRDPPCGSARGMRRRAQHRASYARGSFFRRSAGQRLDPG